MHIDRAGYLNLIRSTVSCILRYPTPCISHLISHFKISQNNIPLWLPGPSQGWYQHISGSIPKPVVCYQLAEKPTLWPCFLALSFQTQWHCCLSGIWQGSVSSIPQSTLLPDSKHKALIFSALTSIRHIYIFVIFFHTWSTCHYCMTFSCDRLVSHREKGGAKLLQSSFLDAIEIRISSSATGMLRCNADIHFDLSFRRYQSQPQSLCISSQCNQTYNILVPVWLCTWSLIMVSEHLYKDQPLLLMTNLRSSGLTQKSNSWCWPKRIVTSLNKIDTVHTCRLVLSLATYFLRCASCPALDGK